MVLLAENLAVQLPSLAPDRVSEDAAKRTRFQCAAFHLTRDGAKPQDGFLCVTSWNNKFVKLRLTTLSDNNTETTARKYVSAWVPVLWGPGSRTVAEPQPAKPEPRAQQVHRRAPERSTRPIRPRRPPPCPPNYICQYR